jgi:hypothetical protein
MSLLATAAAAGEVGGVGVVSGTPFGIAIGGRGGDLMHPLISDSLLPGNERIG